MCGFAALFERHRVFDAKLLNNIDRDLFHRGPDSGGILSEAGCAFVFRRLAIIDISNISNQPMTDPTGRYVLVFNGEIYNYLQLRNELKKLGEVFITNGDAEVILRGFIRWGNKIFSRLEGMFAIIIYDRHTKTGIAARDPLGIKPLYLANKNNLIAFSSEMELV